MCRAREEVPGSLTSPTLYREGSPDPTAAQLPLLHIRSRPCKNDYGWTRLPNHLILLCLDFLPVDMSYNLIASRMHRKRRACVGSSHTSRLVRDAGRRRASLHKAEGTVVTDAVFHLVIVYK